MGKRNPFLLLGRKPRPYPRSLTVARGLELGEGDGRGVLLTFVVSLAVFLLMYAIGRVIYAI